MQIELSDQEIMILDQALEAWTNQPQINGMLSGIMKTVLKSRAGLPDETEADVEQDMKRAIDEQSTRRLRAAVMRAKLAMALRPNP